VKLGQQLKVEEMFAAADMCSVCVCVCVCVVDEDLAMFPVDVHCLSKLRPCVDLARSIDKAQHR